MAELARAPPAGEPPAGKRSNRARGSQASRGDRAAPVSEWPLLTKVATPDRAARDRRDSGCRPRWSPLEQEGGPARGAPSAALTPTTNLLSG